MRLEVENVGSVATTADATSSNYLNHCVVEFYLRATSVGTAIFDKIIFYHARNYFLFRAPVMCKTGSLFTGLATAVAGEFITMT